MGAVSAKSVGTTVTYTYSDGSRIKLTGNRPWRNNNPGNLRYGSTDAATDDGALGRDKGGFGIFPDYETGHKAMIAWWQKKADKGQTIKEALKAYAPPGENDLERYLNGVEKATGESRDTLISELTAEERKSLEQFVKQHEGYNNGAKKGKKMVLAPPLKIKSMPAPKKIENKSIPTQTNNKLKLKSQPGP
jgi:hypothetical protein